MSFLQNVPVDRLARGISDYLAFDDEIPRAEKLA
jgi:hypothetical protein